MQFPRFTSSTTALEREIAELKEENARLREAGDFTWFADHPVPGFIVNAINGQILDVNEAALRLYRYDRKELLNQPFDRFRISKGSSFSRRDLNAGLIGDGNWSVKQQRRDGTVFSAELMVHPLTWRGKAAEFIQIWDISRRIDAEVSLRVIERRYQWLMAHATESLWRFELEVPVPVGLPVEEQVQRFYQYAYLAEASHSTAAIYGYPSAQSMIGIRLAEMLPRSPANDAFLAQFIQSGYHLIDAESLEIDANKQQKWFLNRLVGDVEGGLMVRAWGASLDVTDRKRLEEHQKQTDQLWRDALENLQLLALFLDDQGCVTYLNPYFCKITGWTKEELIGKPLADVWAPWHTGIESQPAGALHSGNLRNYCTSTLQTRSGNLLHIHWNNTLIHNTQGNAIGVFCIGEDVTEQERINAAFQESESRYRRLVDGLPLGLYRSTPEGKLIFANPVALKLLGISSLEAAEHINLNQYGYGPSYSRQEFRQRLDRDGIVHGLEFPWHKPDGQEYWLREHARVVRDEQGRITCYEGTLEDITLEKLATRSNEERKEHYRMLSELAPIGIVMTCLGRIIHVNQFMTRMLGYDDPDELMNHSILDFIHASDRDGIAEAFLNIPEAGGQSSVIERRLIRKDGSTLYVQAHVALVNVNNKRGSVIVVRDISEERHAESERRRWQQRILEMQKLESLGLLAGGLAHDFNNQLTVILGHACLMQKQLPPDNALLALVQPIEQAARHSTDLCQQMLSFAGRSKIKMMEANLTQLVQDTAGLLTIACAKKAQLHFELDVDLPQLQVDHAQLRQVLINLVSNASESMPPDQQGNIYIKTGKIRVDQDYQNPEVTLELPPGEYVHLDVTDNGSGMDVDTRRRIFEPFFTTKTTGRGLGLPAVLGIIRSHGGAIEVTSKLRQGSVFRVFLPINKPVAASPVVPPDTMMNATPGSILVVDDDPSLRALICQVLKKRGWKVYEAADGETACDLVQQPGCDIRLALIDLVLPGLDGVETLKQLWKVQPLLAAIAMSSYGAAELEHRFAGYPLKGVLPKPFTPASLEKAVDHILRTHPIGTVSGEFGAYSI